MDKCIHDDKKRDDNVEIMKHVHADRQVKQLDDDIDEGTDHAIQNVHLPKDQGWAWFVLLGATLVMLLQLGIVKSAGILFVAFQEKFHSSSSVTSLLSTVQNFCQSITGFLVMICGIKITTYRNLVFIGSSISCIAYIITSQATDIRVLLFSHGVVQGVGVGISLPATVTMVSLYFEKRRGLANSIAVSGGPVGGIIFASLITHLLKSYGYQGCVLVLAGILLNGCVSGALFRPTSFYYNKKSIRNRKPDKDTDVDDEESKNLFMEYRKQIPANLNKLMTDSKYNSSSSDEKVKSELYNLTEKENLNIDVKVSMECIAKQTRSKNVKNRIIQHYISKYCNLQLLRNPVFLAFLLQGSLIASGTLVAPIFLVPHARDLGVSSEDIATLVTTQSCIDLLARLLIGYISDKRWLRRSTIVAIASMIVALSSSFLRFYTTFSLLLGYSVVLGLVSGVYFSLYTVVLIDYLTLSNFQTSLGFMSLVHGFSIAGVFYLVGYLRDISGSYMMSYQVIGATTAFGAFIMFMLPVIERLKK